MEPNRSSRFSVLAFFCFALLGLFPAWMVAKAITYRSQGFDKADILSADCDDCELTVLLDGIGYLAAVMGAYLVLCVIAFIAFKRAGVIGGTR